MIKLDLQSLKQQDQSMTDLEKRLNELYSDASRSEKKSSLYWLEGCWLH